jgi:hypothetical protein
MVMNGGGVNVRCIMDGEKLQQRLRSSAVTGKSLCRGVTYAHGVHCSKMEMPRICDKARLPRGTPSSASCHQLGSDQTVTASLVRSELPYLGANVEGLSRQATRYNAMASRTVATPAARTRR